MRFPLFKKASKYVVFCFILFCSAVKLTCFSFEKKGVTYKISKSSKFFIQRNVLLHFKVVLGCESFLQNMIFKKITSNFVSFLYSRYS